MALACPECGGEIQATVQHEDYYVLHNSDSGPYWRLVHDDLTETRFYCANDHKLPDDLVKQMPDICSYRH